LLQVFPEPSSLFLLSVNIYTLQRFFEKALERINIIAEQEDVVTL
jgi:hypothetical protein